MLVMLVRRRYCQFAISVPSRAHCRRWPGMQEDLPADTNRNVKDKLKCYILTRRVKNNLLIMVFWFLYST